MQYTSYDLPSRKFGLSNEDETPGSSFRQVIVQDQATSARLHSYIEGQEGYDVGCVLSIYDDVILHDISTSGHRILGTIFLMQD